MAFERFWEPPLVGYVGYAGDEPVTTTVVIPFDGMAYVAWVATSPDHRRRGYAQAIMRYALSNARAVLGTQRTHLHATDAGSPVYRKMGY